MNKNLKNYIKKYNNVLNKNLCDSITNSLDKNNFFKHTFYDPVKNLNYDRMGDKELSVSFQPVQNIEIINNIVKELIIMYCKGLNFQWFDGINKFTNIRFNRYEKNNLMDLHCDHIHDIFDGINKGVPILSILGLLNSDFKGGEFIMFDNYNLKLKKGDILIFPSNFLYPHKVKEIKKGIRYSFISWAY
jgi:hypothetical protein